MKSSPAINPYWSKLDITMRDQEKLDVALKNLCMITINMIPFDRKYSSIDNAKNHNLQIVNEILFKYNITDIYATLPGEPSIISCKEGLESIVDTLSYPGIVVGISGPPAAGKTTILNQLSKKGFYTIDEYWQEGPESDNTAKLTHLIKERKKNGLSTVVASANIYEENVDIIVYLKPEALQRKDNLTKRSVDSDKDKIRLGNYDLYELIDFFRYGVRRIGADVVVKAPTDFVN